MEVALQRLFGMGSDRGGFRALSASRSQALKHKLAKGMPSAHRETAPPATTASGRIRPSAQGALGRQGSDLNHRNLESGSKLGSEATDRPLRSTSRRRPRPCSSSPRRRSPSSGQPTYLRDPGVLGPGLSLFRRLRRRFRSIAIPILCHARARAHPGARARGTVGWPRDRRSVDFRLGEHPWDKFSSVHSRRPAIG